MASGFKKRFSLKICADTDRKGSVDKKKDRRRDVLYFDGYFLRDLRSIDQSVGSRKHGHGWWTSEAWPRLFLHSFPAPQCNQPPHASICLTVNAKFSVVSWCLPSKLALVYTFTLDAVKQAWFSQCCISSHLADREYTLENRWEKKIHEPSSLLVHFWCRSTLNIQTGTFIQSNIKLKVKYLVQGPTLAVKWQQLQARSLIYSYLLWISQSAAQHFSKYPLSKTTSNIKEQVLAAIFGIWMTQVQILLFVGFPILSRILNSSINPWHSVVHKAHCKWMTKSSIYHQATVQSKSCFTTTQPWDYISESLSILDLLTSPWIRSQKGKVNSSMVQSLGYNYNTLRVMTTNCSGYYVNKLKWGGSSSPRPQDQLLQPEKVA